MAFLVLCRVLCVTIIFSYGNYLITFYANQNGKLFLIQNYSPVNRWMAYPVCSGWTANPLRLLELPETMVLEFERFCTADTCRDG